MKHLPPSRWLLTVCFVTIGAFRAIGETYKKPDLPPQEVIDAVFSQGPSPPVQVLVENTPLINSTEQKKIDIALPMDHITEMGVLILGGTAATLERNFSAKHIADIGDRLLKRWSSKRDPKDRLADCLRVAPVNPWKED